MRVQHVDAACSRSAGRSARRRSVARRCDSPRRHVDRRLGRPVQVVQRRVGQRSPCNRCASARRQRLAAADDARAGSRSRTGVDCSRNTCSIDGTKCSVVIACVARSARPGTPGPCGPPGRASTRRRAGQQRPEELPHRDVEAERRLLQHRVAGRQRVGLLHPVQPVDHAAVLVHHALGPAGRAGGVDDVGQMLGRADRASAAGVVCGQFRTTPRPCRPASTAAARYRVRATTAACACVSTTRGAQSCEHVREPLAADTPGRAARRRRRPSGSPSRPTTISTLRSSTDADPGVRPDAARDSVVRQLVRSRVELGVASAVRRHKPPRRHPASRATCVLEQLVDAQLSRDTPLACRSTRRAARWRSASRQQIEPVRAPCRSSADHALPAPGAGSRTWRSIVRRSNSAVA